MFKKAVFFLGVLLMASSFAYAEEKFTVSGEVTFQYDGNIYICLLWKDFEISIADGMNYQNHHVKLYK